MVKFEGKILLIGCGSIGQCTIPLLLKLIEMPRSNLTVLDFVDNRDKIQPFLQEGIQYVQKHITEDNFREILSAHLSPGDILLDLAWNLDTADLLDWCYHHHVNYLNTSVELWSPFSHYFDCDPRELTLYHRHMRLRKMMNQWRDNREVTMIVDHGANPGLISHFTKQGLLDIAKRLLQKNSQKERRKELEIALANENFALLSSLLGVKTIHISEKDTQIINIPKKVNEFVNTWSITGFIEEGMAPAELGWGTHEKFIPAGAMFHTEGPQNQICLSQKGIKTWMRSWVPSGEITGMLVRHSEAFTISENLTLWENQTPIYRPTVHYVYSPCDAAIDSLHELEMRHYVPQEKHRVASSEIVEGKDELGALLMGHEFQSWWVGSILDIEEARRLVPGQNATSVQVAISVAAATVHIIRHPNLGFCLPEQIDHREILSIAKPYLGQYISMPVDWSPLVHARFFTDFNQPLPTLEDCWQFPSFSLSLRNFTKKLEEEKQKIEVKT